MWCASGAFISLILSQSHFTDEEVESREAEQLAIGEAGIASRGWDVYSSSGQRAVADVSLVVQVMQGYFWQSCSVSDGDEFGKKKWFTEAADCSPVLAAYVVRGAVKVKPVEQVARQ